MYRNKKGVTLIELIIVIAIMGIVIYALSSLLFAGIKSFEVGKDKGFAQQEARLAATVITRELRTAVEGTVNADPDSMADPDFKKIDKDSFDNVSSLSFLSEGNDILKVDLTVEEQNSSQEIKFEVLLENTQNLGDFDSSKEAIYYKKYEGE